MRILVDDLGAQRWQSIAVRATPPLVRLVLGVLRDARALTPEELFARWGGLLAEAARELGAEALRAVISHLSEVRKIEEPTALLAAARTVPRSRRWS